MATVAPTSPSPTLVNSADPKKKGQKTIDAALNKIEEISEWPLEKLARLGQKLESSKNPTARWFSNICQALGITPNQSLTDLISSMEVQQSLNPLVIHLMDVEALAKGYKNYEDWAEGNPTEFQSRYDEFLKVSAEIRYGNNPELAELSNYLIDSNQHADNIVNQVLNELKLRKEVQETNAKGETITVQADKNIELFFKRGKVSKKIKELVEKTPKLKNNPELQRTIGNLAETKINQRFEGMAQIFNFGIFPTMVGPLFVNAARMASEMGNSFLSQIAMALALGAFSTQSIAIGKSVANLPYGGLGPRIQKLIAPLLFLTWFSHIFASFTRIGGVFFDVSSEEKVKPNAFTPIKQFLSNFFFKPIEVLARIVNSSSFALFFAKDLAELNTHKNSGIDHDSLTYKTELNVIKAKTAFNGIATIGTTISNIGGLFAEHKQEAIYNKLESLIKLLNGEEVSKAQIMNDTKLPPEAKALAMKFIDEKAIVMPQIEKYGSTLVAQVKAGKLSPEKAQALLEKKQEALGAKLEAILQQMVALIQDKTKGVSQQAWLFESIGTLSFLGILPSLLCRRSMAGLTEAARLIDTDKNRFAGKNKLVKFCRAYGEVINSGKHNRDFGALIGGQSKAAKDSKSKMAKFGRTMGAVGVWAEIPFMLLMAGISVGKLITAENSLFYNQEFAQKLSQNKGLTKFTQAVEFLGNFAMLV